LHEKGSSNPLSICNKLDKQLFHPYFTIKDTFVAVSVFFLFALIAGFYPNLLGHPDNYLYADPLVTPPHIVPE
jgi:quinol-cytochrome oxidoreductase complex cytochrome b subunit